MRRQFCKGNFLNGVALCLMLLSASGCRWYIPAVKIHFADHMMIFHLVGSDRVEDVKFRHVEEKPKFDPILGALTVSGEGELEFLELVIQFNSRTISVNGVPVDLSKEVSFNRVVYQDGTIFEGDVNMP